VGIRRDEGIKHVRFLTENCRGLIAEIVLEAHFDPELARLNLLSDVPGKLEE
jgi:hypothetical protein